MSFTILEKAKEFLVRLVKDETFRAQLMSEKAEEVRQVLEDGGYKFSQAEFETAAIKILELKDNGGFDELSEQELVGAIGGVTTLAVNNFEAIAIYGSVIPWPPENGHPIPPTRPHPRPRPKPFPPVQALYGVIVDNLNP